MYLHYTRRIFLFNVTCGMVLRTRAILVTDAGKILLVKVKGMAHFCLPGGKVDAREATLDALRRELHEEVGLIDVALHLRYIVELPHINSFETYYVANIEEGSISMKDATHFSTELEDIGFFEMTAETPYYPKWLKYKTKEELLKMNVEYLGVLTE